MPPPSIEAPKHALSNVEQEGPAPAEGATVTEPSGEGERPAKASEKFFIVKSLTVEDLELSVRNGIWATQAHNEAALNKAFEVGAQ